MSAAALMLPPDTARTWSKACGVCRRAYDRATWAALATVAMLPTHSVQAHLTVNAAWTVELRRCGCGAVLAARSP